MTCRLFRSDPPVWTIILWRCAEIGSLTFEIEWFAQYHNDLVCRVFQTLSLLSLLVLMTHFSCSSIYIWSVIWQKMKMLVNMFCSIPNAPIHLEKSLSPTTTYIQMGEVVDLNFWKCCSNTVLWTFVAEHLIAVAPSSSKGTLYPSWVPHTPSICPQALSKEATASLLQQWVWDEVFSWRVWHIKRHPFITCGYGGWCWHSRAAAPVASGLVLLICAVGFLHNVFCEAPLCAVCSAEVSPSPSKALPQRESKITFFDEEL